MAKTSMKIKQQRAPKFSTRAYTRCRICGRPHSVPAQVWRLPHLLPGTCLQGPDPRRAQGQLVTEARRFSNACNDPIADMLTRIRNALIAKHDHRDDAASNMKKAIANILLDEGYIKSVDYIDDGLQGQIKIVLKYAQGKESVIKGLKRISKPGLRVYAKNDEIPRVLGGLGVAIVSTSKGVMSDRSARAAGIGGEVLAYVW